MTAFDLYNRSAPTPFRGPAPALMPALALALTLALTGAGPAAAQDPQPAPAAPQPSADALQPGLTVDYYYGYFNWIDELLDTVASSDPDPGPPLPLLDYQTGTEKVLTSNKDNGVGAHIRGLLYFDEPGEYSLVAQSNDGVRIVLGGVKIIEDPDVHSDQYSRIVNVDIPAPAWYPLEVHYFEKKNTSTLKLLWRKPSSPKDAEMTVIPAQSYAHPK